MDLTDDLWAAVFALLASDSNGYKDLSALSRVSRRFERICSDNLIWYLAYRSCLPVMSSEGSYITGSGISIDYHGKLKDIVSKREKSKVLNREEIIDSTFLLSLLKSLYPHREEWGIPSEMPKTKDNLVNYEYYLLSIVPDDSYFRNHPRFKMEPKPECALIAFTLLHSSSDPIDCKTTNEVPPNRLTRTTLFIDIYSKSLFAFLSFSHVEPVELALRLVDVKRNLCAELEMTDDVCLGINFYSIDYTFPALQEIQRHKGLEINGVCSRLLMLPISQPNTFPPNHVLNTFKPKLNQFITSVLPHPITKNTLILSINESQDDLSVNYGKIEEFDHETNKVQRTLEFNLDLLSIDICDGKVITGHTEHLCIVWDYETCSQLFRYQPCNPEPDICVFSALLTDNYLITLVSHLESQTETTFQVWNDKGTMLNEHIFDDRDGSQRIISFEGVNQLLFYTFLSGKEVWVSVWDWDKNQEIYTTKVHADDDRVVYGSHCLLRTLRNQVYVSHSKGLTKVFDL